MKITKLLLTFLVFAGLAACSSDDSSDDPLKDPIIGEWLIEKHFIGGEEVELEDCEGQTGVTFFDNGNVTLTDFYEDPDTGECFSELTTHKWQNLGDNNYKFTHQNGETRMVTFTFSNNNNTFIISEEDGSYAAMYNRT